ncbi:MAG: hypothetical protein WA294_19505 [Acidobacteriaceae bacterium]
MLAKKLLTLACAAGILALGACFLPPPAVHRPPPPRIDLHGIRRICVTASNKSESHHLNARYLAPSIAASIDSRVDDRILRASAACESSNDGALQIDILSESAAPQENPASSGSVRWSVAVTLNATLTDREGAVVWRADNFEFRSPAPLPGLDAESMWRTREGQIEYLLANRLATRFLHGD